MKKYLFCLSLILVIASCTDAKKEKLDELFGQQKKVMVIRDSLSKEYRMMKNSIKNLYDDTTFHNAKFRLSIELNDVEKQLRVIQFSIDSVSKY